MENIYSKARQKAMFNCAVRVKKAKLSNVENINSLKIAETEEFIQRILSENALVEFILIGFNEAGGFDAWNNVEDKRLLFWALDCFAHDKKNQFLGVYDD